MAIHQNKQKVRTDIVTDTFLADTMLAFKSLVNQYI